MMRSFEAFYRWVLGEEGNRGARGVAQNFCTIVQLQTTVQNVGGTNSANGVRAGVPSHNESMTDKRSPALTAPTPSLDPLKLL